MSYLLQCKASKTTKSNLEKYLGFMGQVPFRLICLSPKSVVLERSLADASCHATKWGLTQQGVAHRATKVDKTQPFPTIAGGWLTSKNATGKLTLAGVMDTYLPAPQVVDVSLTCLFLQGFEGLTKIFEPE